MKIVHRKAEIVRQAGKTISTRMGTYSHDVTVALARKQEGKIVSVRDIVRVQYGRLNDRNERYVRGKISAAVNMLLMDGIPAFPIYEAGGRHRVMGIKVITEFNETDNEALEKYAEAAKHRGELSKERFVLIKTIMKKMARGRN